MARHANQKQKLLVLLRVLWEQSDDEHPMTVGELLAALERQGLKGERKSIYTDMEALRAFGIDVVNRRGKGGGWYLGPVSTRPGSSSGRSTSPTASRP